MSKITYTRQFREVVTYGHKRNDCIELPPRIDDCILRRPERLLRQRTANLVSGTCKLLGLDTMKTDHTVGIHEFLGSIVKQLRTLQRGVKELKSYGGSDVLDTGFRDDRKTERAYEERIDVTLGSTSANKKSAQVAVVSLSRHRDFHQALKFMRYQGVQLTTPLWDRTVSEILEGEKPLKEFREAIKDEVDAYIGLHNELLGRALRTVENMTPFLVPTQAERNAERNEVHSKKYKEIASVKVERYNSEVIRLASEYLGDVLHGRLKLSNSGWNRVEVVLEFYIAKEDSYSDCKSLPLPNYFDGSEDCDIPFLNTLSIRKGFL